MELQSLFEGSLSVCTTRHRFTTSVAGYHALLKLWHVQQSSQRDLYTMLQECVILPISCSFTQAEKVNNKVWNAISRQPSETAKEIIIIINLFYVRASLSANFILLNNTQKCIEHNNTHCNEFEYM